ncbi:MAG: hypothetical protein JOY98_15905 [Candidatus Eremiobacteraeota bacterium]|nr:hypothetical protein [Candidatus Eremiobacteraeota bacterium]
MRNARLVLAVFAFASCGGDRSGILPNAVPSLTTHTSAPQHKSQVLFVVTQGSGPSAILEFPVTAKGNAAPALEIAGTKTQLDNPLRVALDSNGTIYAGTDNPSAIVLAFSPAAHGNVKPIHVLTGSATQLPEQLEGLYVDKKGAIWVSGWTRSSSATTGTVTAYEARASGNVAPFEGLAFGGGTIPLSIATDGAGKIFVGLNTGSILVYARGASGTTTKPLYTIGGSNTGLSSMPLDMVFDGRGRLIVATGRGVAAFARGAKGNARPVNAFATNGTPGGVAVDDAGDIYVADQTVSGWAIDVYAPNARGGKPHPLREISGVKTGFDDILGVAIR